MATANQKIGLNSIDDLLDVRFKSAIELGLETIQPVLQADLEIHNRLTTDAVSGLADISQDRRRIYGTSDTMEMIEADEFTRAHTQKGQAGVEVMFPLRGFQIALGWDQAYFENKSVADMAQSQLSAEKGHLQRIRKEVQRAFYLSGNYSMVDYRVDKVTLNVKRLLNADGAGIPDGPNGEVFDGTTHTHFLAVAGLDAASADAVLATVLEHHQGGKPVIVINRADQTAWEALPKYKPYVDQRLTLNANSNEPTQRLDPFTTDDKPIGLYGAAEVWLKPWALANYAVVYDTAAPKPLVCRVRKGNALTLKVAAKLAFAPLYADVMESEFGFGVWTRTNGAVLYSGGGAYVDPVI
jgi:hypothetical protein